MSHVTEWILGTLTSTRESIEPPREQALLRAVLRPIIAERMLPGARLGTHPTAYGIRHAADVGPPAGSAARTVGGMAV